MAGRYSDLNTYLRNRFGCRVQKITLDAGLTCPNRDGTLGVGGCIYCNARGSGTGAHEAGLSIRAQLERGKAAIARRYGAEAFIAYFQSFTNTYGDIGTLRRLYDQALAVDGVVGLSVGTRPDCTAPEALDLLESYAQRCMVWVEYGLQSIHDRTLRLINRGHDASQFVQAVEATRGRGIDICAHVILGLPGESRADMLATADAIAGLALDGVKLHLLYVVRGSALEALYREGRYRCLEQDEYVQVVCDVLERLPSGTVIQRLTGDPHRDDLVAPHWALKKSETIALIRRELDRRDSRQGCRCD